MTKQALNKYIGKRVEVTFTDGDVLHGTLGHGMGLGNRIYNEDTSYYNLPENNLSFRAYHVKKIKELENEL